jgi:pyridoxal phosphate enzyme (YggS family)
MEASLIFNNIKDVYIRICRAAMKADRSPEEVKLIAVTKTVGTDAIRAAVESGLRSFGENRVQEAKKKVTSDELQLMNERIDWNLIGHLQKNKAKDAVQLFDLIHSVDSAELAEELNRQAAKLHKVQRVLIQVKLSEEETKHGVEESGLLQLIEQIMGMEHIKAEGLMTIPPYFEDPERSRPYFNKLKELSVRSKTAGFALPELSMGMSHDFEIAIDEGATMVRVGTAIFGERSRQ